MYGVGDIRRFVRDCWGLVNYSHKPKMVYRPKVKGVLATSGVWTLDPEDRPSTTELISQSDIVISMAFTSPTTEAWAMGVPGLFYDVGNKYPNNIYAGRGVVARDERELRRMVIRAKSGMMDETFNELREEFELDGTGIHGMRGLLKYGKELRRLGPAWKQFSNLT